MLKAGWIALAATGLASATAAQTTLAETVRAVAASPELAHGRVGVKVLALGSGQVRFSRDGDRFFTPASTTKLISSGAVLALLGPDYRFHTRIYRTGPVRGGVLNGDIVIVASGDANLSGRVRPDGTLGFVDEDHSYGGPPLPGDPVAPLTRAARDIAALGIRRVTGTVLVDTSMFQEGDPEEGSGMTFSPIVVNDNAIDVTIVPGAAGRAPAVTAAPEVAHVRFVNRLTTGAAGSEMQMTAVRTIADDGMRVVTLAGSVPAGHETIHQPYGVDVPSRFAADAMIAALAKAGVRVAKPSRADPVDGTAFAAAYRPDMQLADIVSPPLSEDVRITLKVSQNIHAGLYPYVIGSVVAGAHGVEARKAGLRRIYDWLAQAGLDMSGAAMGDGFGSADAFTPDFMVRYLAFMAKQPVFSPFKAGLPVLGRDGTLANIQKESPAAGQVFAKTGTWTFDDLLGHSTLVEAKGLAGYTSGPDGAPLAFAIYVNKVPLFARDGVAAEDRVGPVAGQDVGKIAAAVHLLPGGDDSARPKLSSRP